MKYCPSCQINYTDDGLQFCLEDGNRLLGYSGQSSQMPTLAFSETETVVRQNPTLPGWEASRITQKIANQPEVKKSNAPLIVIVTALTMCFLFGGAAGVWMLLSLNNAKVNVPPNKNIGIYNASNTFSSPSPRPTSTVKKGTGWEPIDNQASLTGTNLTYYRGTTVEQCQADCGKNPRCKAFTLIRAGAYNPDDPPMCYLASEVTGSVHSACCISGIKSAGDD